MSYKIIESFDLVGSTTDIQNKSHTNAEGTYSASAGRWGDGCVDLGSSNGTVLSQTLTAHATESYVSFAYHTYMSSLPTNGAAGLFGQAYTLYPGTSNLHAGFLHAGSGDITIYTAGTNRATVVGAFTAATWHHVEMRAYINNSGTFDVLIDGVSVYSASVDTTEAVSGLGTLITGGSGSTNFYIDDVVVEQNNTAIVNIGDHRIQTLLPDADSTDTAWTGTYADVDDAINASSNGDTDYISSSVLNDKESFTLADLSVTPASIHAVNVVTEARKTDAGSKGVTSFVVSNGTTGAGTEDLPAETYGYASDTFTVDPDTTTAWTESGVNAMTVGVEVTT